MIHYLKNIFMDKIKRTWWIMGCWDWQRKADHDLVFLPWMASGWRSYPVRQVSMIILDLFFLMWRDNFLKSYWQGYFEYHSTSILIYSLHFASFSNSNQPPTCKLIVTQMMLTGIKKWSTQLIPTPSTVRAYFYTCRVLWCLISIPYI